MRVLGLNAYHADASAALIQDGEVTAAVEEERLTRIKHDAGLPVQAVRWLLESAGLSLRDIDHVAVSKNPHTHGPRRAASLASRSVRARRLPAAQGRALKALRNLPDDLYRELGYRDAVKPSYHFVEHHPAHMASAFFASQLEDALICSVDGLGDHVSFAWGTGTGTRFNVKKRVFFPHSLGFFYTAITQYLGFPHYGDEYKMMGLAPYGQPAYLTEMRRLVRRGDAGDDFKLGTKYYRHVRGHVSFDFAGGPPVIGPLFAPALEELLGPPRVPGQPLEQRHRDIAASAQVALEEVLLPIFAHLRKRTGHEALALAGGVALNVTANTKLPGLGFASIYIPPAAHDGGTSAGAGLYVAHQLLGLPRGAGMTHAYLGPRFSRSECETALQDAGLTHASFPTDEALCRRTAELIAEGRIVGWFQGAAEFGPRALGNRSIVCDPRRADMKDILNSRTKRREAFRPFAPSVLEERARDVFDFEVLSPFMLFAPAVRADWQDRLPAVTHVDGTGRFQTVSKASNARYWGLLSAFNDLTGVPVLLNTSFNENEPIVCTPQEAIRCFLRADMDVLVLGDFLVELGNRQG